MRIALAIQLWSKFPNTLSAVVEAALKLGGVLFGAFFWLAIGYSAAAMTRINDDRGGSLGQYMIMFTELRDSGERVMIDGSCFSACTLVTALIPKERVCVTERAKLGFHASWVEESGERAISKDATRLLYQMYPPKMQMVLRNVPTGDAFGIHGFHYCSQTSRDADIINYH